MKHGKNPTRSQKKFLQQWKLKPEDWLVVKDTSEQMELVHRYSDKTKRIIPKDNAYER